jgi:TonB family protein
MPTAVLSVLMLVLAPAAAAAQSVDGGATLTPFWLERPAYPLIAQSARVQGVVVLRLAVGGDGHVTNVDVVRHIPLFTPVAVDAARGSRFICRGCVEGRAATYTLTYDFRLSDEAPTARIGRGDSTLAVHAPLPMGIFCQRPYPVRAASCLYLWRCGTAGGGCYSSPPVPSRERRRR